MLVVGDGCTDETGDVVQSLAQEDPRIRWFDLPKGPGFGYANRNVALKEAKGELIGFMADDDLMFGPHLEHLVALMDNPQAQLGIVGSLWVDSAGNIIPAIGPLESPSYFEKFMKGENRLPASAFIHRRSVFEEIGYWSETIERSGDLDFWQRIIGGTNNKEAIATDPRPSLVHFRAPWKKKGTDPDPHDFYVWQQLIDSSQLPAELKIVNQDLEKNSFQQYLWNRLSSDSDAATNLELAGTKAFELFAAQSMEELGNLHQQLGQLGET